MGSILEPDQDVTLWDRFAGPYEAMFEPLTDGFAAPALEGLAPLAGARLVDLCAGTGGAALMAARAGARVVALDGAAAMVRRVRERALGLPVEAVEADVAALDLPPDAFDAAISVFGVILLPDPAGALRRLAPAMRAGGRLALVTWTRPERYALVSRLRAAMLAEGVTPPAGPLPAQLRYVDPAAFAALVEAGGFEAPRITTLTGHIEAPGARALADALGFAPGLARLIEGLGGARARVLDRFVASLEADQGTGPVALEAVAQLALARAR